jgi:hypothetical protein
MAPRLAIQNVFEIIPLSSMIFIYAIEMYDVLSKMPFLFFVTNDRSTLAVLIL